MNRRNFLKLSGSSLALLAMQSCAKSNSVYDLGDSPRPNILFCIADDWGWPHAQSYGDPVVNTDTFDQIAKQGVLFEHAYVSSPSCTPCRGALLTGQYHWRLKENANLWSTLDVNIPTYPLLLEKSGYHVGYWRKSWGPGNLQPGGYTDTHPAGTNYPKGFQQFLEAKPASKPFCFWLGSSDPHRAYKKGSGKDSGMDISKVPLPAFYPDSDEIRSDIADYYWEVQRFNRDCGDAIKLLKETGQLENTIVVMTGDHGMPFPRCKGNLYDMGVRVPMAIQWPAKVKPNRRVDDFMSFVDLAPTFLQAAGAKIPAQMVGRSLLPTLLSKKQGMVDPARANVIFGRERHTPAQKSPSIAGYPSRGIRTKKYLYIRNFAPNRWPAGVPEGATHPMNNFSDCDNGPTKKYLMDNNSDPKVKPYYDLCFAKRPAEELYEIATDPDNIKNLAANPKFAGIKSKMSKMLTDQLTQTADPRIIGGGEIFDQYPYRAGYKINNAKAKP
ncbi:MAG: sulfatase [Phycisphaerae bacterium]|nr:sulfatase [Phycisphaerae bacterium]